MRINTVNSVLAKIHKEIDAEIAQTSNPARLRRTLKLFWRVSQMMKRPQFSCLIHR